MKRSKYVKNFSMIDCSPKFINKLIEKAVTKCSKIESLSISITMSQRNIILPEFPSTIKVIRSFEYLQTLEINNVYIGEDSQSEIAKFKTLKSLKINGKSGRIDVVRTHFSMPDFFKKLAKNSKQLETIEFKEDAVANFKVSSKSLLNFVNIGTF